MSARVLITEATLPPDDRDNVRVWDASPKDPAGLHIVVRLKCSPWARRTHGLLTYVFSTKEDALAFINDPGCPYKGAWEINQRRWGRGILAEGIALGNIHDMRRGAR